MLTLALLLAWLQIVQPVRIVVDEGWHAEGKLTYQACNDSSCLPPQEVEFSITGGVGEQENGGVGEQENGGLERLPEGPRLPVPQAPVLLYPGKVFLLGLLAGLAALLTPCVWPMVPLTVGHFMKHRGGAKACAAYGLSIIVIYVGLGLLATLAFGAGALNEWSTSAGANLLFFLLLIVFGLGLIGGFDLSLPSSWTTWLDARSRRSGGLLGIFLMAAMLCVVTFSCTGPIVGFLLVQVASGVAQPIAGLTGFALALALPYRLFALVPQWLHALPRSGAWMQSVRFSLGIIELAFAMKFLSVADLAYGWGLMSREAFVSIWAALALVLALHWLGLLRNVRPAGIIVGAACLSLSIYIASSLAGNPATAIAAFAPPAERGHSSEIADFDEALARAQSEGRPLLVEFTGYGCVNCRKMEATVWADERVRQALAEQYVVVRLYVDDRTDGPRWAALQRDRFGANAQPFCVKVAPSGEQIGTPMGYTDSPEDFLKWLNQTLTP